MRSTVRSGGRSAYAGLTLLLVAFLTYSVPIPSDRVTLGTLSSIPLSAQPGGGRLAIVGNSVVKYRSPCDTDQRSLAQTIGEAVHKPVLDLSYPGQQLAESINYAAMAAQSPAVSEVLVLLSAFALDTAPGLDVHTQAFYRLAAGPFYVDDLAPRLLGGEPFTADPPLQDTAFTYEGMSYPDYAGIKQDYLSVETKYQGCPEASVGVNRKFIEANYWNQYLRGAMHRGYIADLARLQGMVAARSKTMRIVLLPIDYDDIRQLNPGQAKAIASGVAKMLAAMHEAGLDVQDETASLPAEAFSNRWCACGHLQQAGRQDLADRIAGDLR